MSQAAGDSRKSSRVVGTAEEVEHKEHVFPNGAGSLKLAPTRICGSMQLHATNGTRAQWDRKLDLRLLVKRPE